MKTISLVLIALLFTGCEKNSEQSKKIHYELTDEVEKAPIVYVDFEKFKEGRPCDEVKFICLPESQDKSWQSVPLKNGLDLYELSPKIIQEYDLNVKEMWRKYEAYHSKSHSKGEKKPMFVTQLERNFLDKVKAKQFLVDMENNLEKEFPGFWKNIDKPVRYRWLSRAMSKAEKFGYASAQNNMMIELCARIGLDFDLNPKWKSITEFISIQERYIGIASKYIDFTIFEKDYSRSGSRITDWSLRTALRYLPKPNRPIPRLND
ncbi:MAG: hypothetical protein GQ531_09790 [Sulfurovum sp.]|nr:hypothetical protein [Sulfurovum sp.]